MLAVFLSHLKKIGAYRVFDLYRALDRQHRAPGGDGDRNVAYRGGAVVDDGENVGERGVRAVLIERCRFRKGERIDDLPCDDIRLYDRIAKLKLCLIGEACHIFFLSFFLFFRGNPIDSV